MEQWPDLLASAIGIASGKGEERAIASLFSHGDTVDGAEFDGIDDRDVLA